MKKALIIGSSSGVGRALAEGLAEKQWNLVLCSRNKRDLEAIAADLSLKYLVQNQVLAIDINDEIQRNKLISLCTKNKDLETVFITVGDVSDDDNGLQSPSQIDALVNSNFLSILHILSELIKGIEKQSRLTVVIMSSIAISRPRKNNLVYATSKSAIDFYSRGLQHLLVNTSVKMIIFRLGYIDTAMSFGKKLLFPCASPAKTAAFIIAKLNLNKRIHYYPMFWKYLTLIIRLVPWSIYKRISF